MSLVIPWFPLWLAHILRGVCLVVVPFCIILSARLARTKGRDRGQKFRFLGLSLLLLAAAYTEIDRWDANVTPRLFINVAGVFASFIGLWSMRGVGSRNG